MFRLPDYKQKKKKKFFCFMTKSNYENQNNKAKSDLNNLVIHEIVTVERQTSINY